MEKRLRFDKQLGKGNSIRILLAGLAGMGTGIYADTPTGIIGGQDSSSDAYAALVFENGTLAPIQGLGLPADSVINSVAINQSGFSLIGGLAGGANGYVATVSPSGAVNPLASLILPGTISAVAINDSGVGLMGGFNLSLFSGFAAFITADGTITPASGFPDVTANVETIFTAAINNASVGLIGGEGHDAQPYAAYVALDGTVTPLSTQSGFGGQISRVALNSQGTGIIGGVNLGHASYAAFVTPAAEPPLLLSPIPDGSGAQIMGVAINDAGVGLIGGNDASNNAYAGYSTNVADGAVVTPLFNPPFAGIINSVALNSSGDGLIGGQNGTNLYAAQVHSDHSINPIINDTIAGQINWVAINDPGIGLIGGVNSGNAYAALVAPNGALTLLNPNAASISSVALNDGSLLNAVTPQSFGPYLSAAYTQLAAIYALESRFTLQNSTWNQVEGSEVALRTENEEELFVSNEESLLAANNAKLAAMPKSKRKKKPAPVAPKQNSIWIAPFGDFVHLRAQGAIPNFTNEIGGALLAYDHQGSNYLVGTCLGYAFNYIHYGSGIGHGKIQEEMVCVYGSYLRDHFRLNSALWGGLYQFRNTRHTLSMITSKSKTHGWILSPHLEMASPWAIDQQKRYLIEPFFTLDWINSWLHHFTESGSAGFNLKMGNLYSSLLQSEAGLRFYERFRYGWGTFCLEEKASYINQAPFHVNSVATSFVGAASGFPIAVASTKVENLAALQLMGSFNPRNKAYPYGGITFQVMANGSYQSYFISLFTGIDF